MPIHITTQKSREACLRVLPLEATSGSTFPDTRSLQTSGCFSSLLFYDEHCPEFCIRLSHYFIGSDKGNVADQQQDSLLTLQFVLQDALHYKFEDGAQHIMNEGQYNLIAASSVQQINWYDPANIRAGTLDIHFSTEYIQQFACDFPGIHELLDKRRQGLFANLAATPAPLDPVMLHFLNSIISCPYSGALRRTYMQTKVFLLMLVALEQMLIQHDRKEAGFPLNSYEIEKIYEARQYMRQHIDNPPTLKELSRKVGLNDFKLKKGYKQVFNSTVYGDFNDFRMERAKRFLLETDQHISDISLATGYVDPPNFIRAFKAHFGTAPSHYRKLNATSNNKHLS